MNNISLLKQDFKSENLGTSLAVGLLLGVFSILTAIMPIAALIFSGEIQSFIGIGIRILLLTNIIISTISALGSSFQIALARPVNNPVFAVIASSIVVQSVSFQATPTEILTTIIGTLALTSILTGTIMFILGQFKLADLTRFMPYPIFSALIAGLGYLLIKSSFSVMTNISLAQLKFSVLFQTNIILRWLPGTIFAITLYILFHRYNHFLLLPGSILTAIVLFYLTLFITKIPVQEVADTGWLLGPFASVNSSQLNYVNPSNINWSLIFANFTSMISIAIYTILRAPIVCNSAELLSGEEINLNQELKSVGFANILSGFSGGSVGCYSIVPIQLAHKMGVKSRLIGFFHAIPSIIILLFGVSLLSFVPKLVVGGLLLFLGMSMFIDELYKQWFKVSKWDYILILLIVITITTEGLFAGVIVGLVRSSIFFAIRSSQFDVIKNEFYATESPSNTQRPFVQEEILIKEREKIYIYQLEGFIFFGNAHNFISRIKHDIITKKQAINFVIFDFHFLKDLDASGGENILRLKKTMIREQINLLFSDLSAKQEKLLQKAGILQDEDYGYNHFPDFNEAIKWCENKILNESGLKTYISPNLSQQLTDFFPDTQQIKTFMGYLEKIVLEKEQYLFQQGDIGIFIYFIETGEVKTFRELPNGEIKILQTLQGEAIVGEIAFFTNSFYEMSAITEQLTILYSLSVNDFEKMEQENPQLAVIFSKFVISQIAKCRQKE